MVKFVYSLGVTGILTVYVFFMLAIVGWGMNIYKLLHMSFETFTPELIMRLVGLIPIVGGVVGWM